MTLPPAPWLEYRLVAETFAQAMVDSLIAATGADMQLGNPTSFEPGEMLGSRPAPIRAYVVNLEAPLRDVLILFSSLGPDMIEPMLAPAVHGALASIDVMSDDENPKFTIDEPVEYDTAEKAVDQADALYLEASYEIAMPLGDLRVVLGTGLLESATYHVNGMEDPGAIAAAAAATSAAAVDAASESAIDALDRELAEQEARADAILAGLNPDVAVANMGHAQVPEPTVADRPHDTQRWASLLSGVEVELSAELGRTNLELGDITSLVEDRILTLDQMVDEPVTVFVNGTPYATARLVVVDGEYGIEILELLEQLNIEGIAPIFSQIAA